MSNALVVRTQRHKKIGDAASPMVFKSGKTRRAD